MMRNLLFILTTLALSACPPFGTTPSPADLVGTDRHGNPPPRPQKIALVLTDVDDAGAVGEARAMLTALSARGWSTRSNIGSDRPTTELLESLVSEAQSIDQVLIDIQVHGGEPYVEFAAAGGTTDMQPFALGATHYLFNPGRYQPTVAEAGLHGMGMRGVTRTPGSGLTASQLADFTRRLVSRGTETTVIDHSCFGGGSVMAVSAAAPSACVIATSGPSSVSLIGYPAMSGQLASFANFEQASRFVSTTFYDRHHGNADRLHQIGYATGCTDTMMFRERLALTAGSLDTWWHWNRLDVAHVVRTPTRYLNFADAVEPTSRAEHPDTATAHGWQQWFEDAGDVYARTLSGDTRVRFDRSYYALQEIAATGNLALEDLRKAINQTQVATTNSAGTPTMTTLDEYLRDGLIGGCICMQDNTDNPNLLAYQTAQRCNAGRGDLYRNARITATVPALQPNPATCSNPQPFVDAAVAQFPAVQTALSNARTLERQLRDSAIELSRLLQEREQACVSSACLAHGL